MVTCSTNDICILDIYCKGIVAKASTMDFPNSNIQKGRQVFIILSPYCQTRSQFMDLVWNKACNLQIYKPLQSEAEGLRELEHLLPGIARDMDLQL